MLRERVIVFEELEQNTVRLGADRLLARTRSIVDLYEAYFQRVATGFSDLDLSAARAAAG